MRIDASSMTINEYRLRPKPGGRACKTLQYMVKVIKSSGANCQVGLGVQHGPDGDVFLPLDDQIIPMTLVSGASTDALVLEGHVGQDDGSNTKVVGEWILPILKINHDSGTGDVWAVVELFEMRKPY
jgi:hypothetical protein